MTKKTFIYFFSFMAMGMSAGLVGPTMSVLSTKFNNGIVAISLIIVVKPLGAIIGSIIAGNAYDKFNGHIVFGIALITIALGIFLTPLLPSLYLVVAIFFVIGACEGSGHVGGNALLIWEHNQKAGGWINILHCSFCVGCFISPLILGWIFSKNINTVIAYWIIAVVIIATSSILFITSFSAPKSIKPPKNELCLSQPEVSKTFFLTMLIIMAFLVIGAEVSLGSWLSTYSTEKLGLGKSFGAYMTSVYYATLTVGRLSTAPIGKRVKPKIILLTGTAMAIFFGTILLLSTTVLTLCIGIIGIGIALSGLFSTTFSLAEKYLGVSGKVSSMLSVGASAGSLSVSWLMGQFFSISGANGIVIVFVVNLVMALLVTLILKSVQVKIERNPV